MGITVRNLNIRGRILGKDFIPGPPPPPPAPPVPADSRYSVLMLPGTGTNGGTNNTFIDSSSNNFSITRVGNTTQGSFSPYSTAPGYWSNYFDGSGDNLLLYYNSALHLPEDFTIECWFYANAYGGMILNFAGGLNIAWASYELVNQPDGINFAASSANNGYDIGSETGSTGRMGTIQLNTWNHLAVTRSGNVYRGFVNGVQGYSQTLSLSPYNPNSRGLTIGSNYTNTWGSGSPADSVNGYISNLRIVKGAALYTSNFTPSTTPLTAVSGTSLLTCQNNRFMDSSINNFAITSAGNAEVSPFGSFNAMNTYNSSTMGGSIYFDGSGDVLSNTTGNPINFGTANFTAEMWIYANTVSNSTFQVALTTNQQNNGFQMYINYVNGNFVFGGINISEYNIINNMRPKQWYHVAVSRADTGSNQTYVFVNGILTNTYTVADNFNIDGFNVGGYATQLFWNGYISNLRVVKGVALYTQNFTPPTQPVSNVSGTSLLLNGTNAAIVDTSAKNVAETVGSAQISTAVSKWGTGSMYFDGSSFLRVPSSDLFAFGTGDYTLEAWVNLNLNDTAYRFVLQLNYGGTAQLCFRFGDTDFGNQFQFCPGAGSLATCYLTQYTRPGIWLNQWNHVAMTRQNNQVRCFINGNLVPTTLLTDATPYTIRTDNTNYSVPLMVTVGGNGSDNWPGYINDLRITKGLARYTGNFTPPGQL